MRWLSVAQQEPPQKIKRVRLKIGDVFEVKTDSSAVRFFQYVADDVTQLSSYVVRVFKEAYGREEPLDIPRIVAGEAHFHAHVFLRNGIKQQAWRKVGHAPPPDDLDVLFRDSGDYGNPEVTVSTNWYVWKINGPTEDVGKLLPQYQSAEIGVVITAGDLVYRMQHGEYDFIYPGF